MIVKNSYKKNDLPFVPYVYYIRHKPTGIRYIGSKFSHNAHPSLFLKNYFTSSTLIQELLSNCELKDIEFKILKTFVSITETTQYEQRILRKIKAVKNPLFANRDDCQSASETIQVKFKTRKISNPVTKRCLTVKKQTPLPSGWIEGNINKKGQTKRKGWTWFYDPVTLESTMMPADWICPSGWVRGRPDNHSNSTSLTGKYYFATNGKLNRCLKQHELVPFGWRLGITKQKKLN